METTIIWLYLQCSRGLHGPSSVSNTMTIYEGHYNYNVPEIFMVPRAPTNDGKHNFICVLTMLPSVHAPSGVSNTMEAYNGKHHNTIYLRSSGGHPGASSASNNGTHHHIVISTTFRRSSWCLQSLSILEVFMVPPTPQLNGKHNNHHYVCNVLVVLWSLQRLQYNGNTHTIRTLLCLHRSRVNHHPSSASNTFENSVISLHLQCTCRRSSWSLQSLKHNEKHINIVLFTMFQALLVFPALEYNGNMIIPLCLQWERALQCSAGLHGPFTASNTMESTTGSLHLRCHRGLYGASSTQTQSYRGLHGSTSTSKTMERTVTSLYLKCSGGLHGPSSASNTIGITIISLCLTRSGGLHGHFSASNTMGNNIIPLDLQCSEFFCGCPSVSNTMDNTTGSIYRFTMFRRSSWFLPPIKDDWKTLEYRHMCYVAEAFMFPPALTQSLWKHSNINIFAMFWRSSWHSSASNTMNNTIVSLHLQMFQRSSWFPECIDYDGNLIISSDLQCSGRLHGTSGYRSYRVPLAVLTYGNLTETIHLHFWRHRWRIQICEHQWKTR